MFSSYRRRISAGLGALCLVCSALEVSAQITMPPIPAPSAVTALEYFIDTDPGIGLGTPLSVAPGPDVTATALLPLAGLQAGVHRLYYRSKNAAGSWGLSTPKLIYIAPGYAISAAPLSAVSALEYFFDTDPGIGRATALPVTAATDITATGSLSVASLSAGVHYLGLRAANTAGTWGMTTVRPVYIVPNIGLAAHNPPAAIQRAEYFVDADPGAGLGTSIPLSSGTDVSIRGFMVSIGSLPAGVHQIGVRFQDAAGSWSLTNRNRFSVIVVNISIPPAVSARAFTTLEYFFDADPGHGNGQLLTVPATTDLANFSFAADVSALGSGSHVLYVRTVGDWSLTSSQAFRIASPLPVELLRFDARRQEKTVQLSWEAAAASGTDIFVIERSADAVRFDSIGSVPGQSGAGSGARYAFTDRKPLTGIGFYRLKQHTRSGATHYSRTIPVRFDDAATAPFSTNNPVGTELRVFRTGSPDIQTEFSIINQQGQQLAVFRSNGKPVEHYDVSTLPPGSYLLQQRDDGQIHTARFQKR